MAPNVKEEELLVEDDTIAKDIPKISDWNYKILYPVAFYVFFIHAASLYGLWVSWNSVKLATVVYTLVFYVAAVQGIMAGAHRLWSHKTYKAKKPLQILLMLLQSATMQYSVIWWAATHRQHHKFSDTDADPHNANRHLFFTHIGWIMVKPHPEAIKRRKLIDLSDLKSNPILTWQKRHMVLLSLLLSFVVPTLIPYYFWSENIFTAWHLNMFRVTMTYHCIFFVNSIAHRWGSRPYDKSVQGTHTLFVGYFSFGEGWHNYHHVFPWDYSCDEHGRKFSITTLTIEFFEKIGWAYDLKHVPKEMALSRAYRTGDGTPIPIN